MFGSDDCPCIEKYPSHLDASSLDNNTSSKFCNFVNEFGAEYQLTELNCTFPDHYDLGISCKAHDRISRVDCQGPVTPNTPHYCFAEWCYVDHDKCFSSNHAYFEDLPGLYYSYSTCSSSTSFDNLEEQRSSSFHGADITVVLPEYVFPLSFKQEMLPVPNNIFSVFEYTDLQGSFLQGAIIEYFDLIRTETSIKSLSFQIRSGGSRKKFGNSNYTAAVNDVSIGLADIGGGIFWVTTERLALAPFTVPLFYSSLYLYELDKGFKTSFVSSVQNTLRPFSNPLWLVLVLCIIMVGIANVFSSNARSHSKWHRLLYEKNRNSLSRFQRTRAALRVYAASINKSFLQYFDTASETSEMSTFSHKILVFGFGLFILVVCSSYTANLASFLTVKDFGIYVESMDEAIESNLKICAQIALKESIEAQFSRSKSENMVYIPLSEYNYISEASNKLKTGECDVMVADELDLQFIDPTKQEDFCKKHLVSIKTPVMTLYQTIPVSPKFQGSLSKAIMDLTSQGVDFLDILDRYAPTLDCKIYLNSKNVENEQIGPAQMLFPMGLLLICMIIGVIIKTVGHFKKLWLGNDLERENDENVDLSPKNGDLSTEDEDFTVEGYLDMLEAKCRLELISLNVQQLDNRMAKRLQKYEEGQLDSIMIKLRD